MAKRGQKIAERFESRNDGYSSESEESSVSFMAIPKEFRPTQPLQPERKKTAANSTIFSGNGDWQNSLCQAEIKHGNPKGAYSKQKAMQHGHRPNIHSVKKCEYKHKKLEYCIINNTAAQDWLNETNVHGEKKENLVASKLEDSEKGKMSTEERNNAKKSGNRKRDYSLQRNIHGRLEDRNIIWRSSLVLNAEEQSLKSKETGQITEKLEYVVKPASLGKISNIEWSVMNAKSHAYDGDEKPGDCKSQNERKIQYQIKNNEKSPLNHNIFGKEKDPTINNSLNLRVTKNTDKVYCRKPEERCCCGGKSENLTPSTFRAEDRENMSKEQAKKEEFLKKLRLLKKESKKHSNLSEDMNSIINFGKDICDLIVGCHLAFSTLHSIYLEWKNIRNQLIVQFEQLIGTVEANRKTSSSYQELLSQCSQLASLLAIVPDPRVQLVSKLGTVMTGILKAFFRDSKPEETDADVLDITQLLAKDKQLSEELKMHSLQCDMQFKETRMKIEEFHDTLMCDFRECNRYPDILQFLNGVKLYTPRHHTFYRKLHQCFQDLLSKGASSKTRSKIFCEPFFLYEQNAVDIIRYLNWRFIEIQGPKVENELQDIKDLIQNNSSPVNLKIIVLQIQNCVSTLNKELQSVKKCIETIHVFDET